MISKHRTLSDCQSISFHLRTDVHSVCSFYWLLNAFISHLLCFTAGCSCERRHYGCKEPHQCRFEWLRWLFFLGHICMLLSVAGSSSAPHFITVFSLSGSISRTDGWQIPADSLNPIRLRILWFDRVEDRSQADMTGLKTQRTEILW